MNKKDAQKDWKITIGKLFEIWEELAESEAPAARKKKRPRAKPPKRPPSDHGSSTGIGELHAPAVA